MMTRIRCYTVDGWATPPEHQGQIVEVSYGLDADAEVIVERRHDRSDGTMTHTAYAYPDDDDGTWMPWAGAPALGRELGPCHVEVL
jgi:hypothetical protein